MSNVKETKEALECAIKLGEATDRALEDGKFSFADLPSFMPAMMLINDAIDGADKILDELSAMGETENQELKAMIGTLDLRDEKSEQIIKKGAMLLVSAAEFVAMIREARQK